MHSTIVAMAEKAVDVTCEMLNAPESSPRIIRLLRVIKVCNDYIKI